MSYTMNGKPLWCRPARTRCGSDKPAKLDADDAASKHLGLLAEAAQLVAAGIRAGLIKKPDEEYVSQPAPRMRSSDVMATCDKCAGQFVRGKSSSQLTCVACRIGPRPCQYCGKIFPPERKTQKFCSVRCSALERTKEQKRCKSVRAEIPCVVCSTPHPMRWHGAKLVQTCSKPCANVLTAQNCRKPKKQQ